MTAAELEIVLAKFDEVNERLDRIETEISRMGRDVDNIERDMEVEVDVGGMADAKIEKESRNARYVTQTTGLPASMAKHARLLKKDQ